MKTVQPYRAQFDCIRSIKVFPTFFVLVKRNLFFYAGLYEYIISKKKTVPIYPKKVERGMISVRFTGIIFRICVGFVAVGCSAWVRAPAKKRQFAQTTDKLTIIQEEFKFYRPTCIKCYEIKFKLTLFVAISLFIKCISLLKESCIKHIKYTNNDEYYMFYIIILAF